MSISKGDKLPAGGLLKPGADGPEPFDAAELATGRVVIFAVPGAYTPTCTNAHMPSFVKNAGKLRDKGVSRIVCITVNDPFVAGAWSRDTGAGAAGVEVLADADGSYTRALGMDIQGDGWINGRSKRYAMLVEDGEVAEVQVEESPGSCSVSSGESLLSLV
ncbi:Peroxiredoxin [Paracoccus halophilus]|uniref:Glutathione-dependent peroxiredoxin n=1 Tax=Paracoccus halophilus TaxID=376733 RepID=A0A099F599_9RHOB|nr:peroxiredoxin [Paracoccus halophilus]KGJ05589.1 thiol peroxidase [Paracoccus halophilus]SFA47213.1 Peroxiredoxin [Paracoccus halophilus]